MFRGEGAFSPNAVLRQNEGDAMTRGGDTGGTTEQWRLSLLDCRLELNLKKWWWDVEVVGRGPGPEWGPHLYKDRHFGPIILVFVLPQSVPFRRKIKANHG